MHDHVIGPFVFVENTITATVYLDMLELYVFPQVEDIETEKALVSFSSRMGCRFTTALSSNKLSTTDSLAVGLGGMTLFCGHLEVLI